METRIPFKNCSWKKKESFISTIHFAMKWVPFKCDLHIKQNLLDNFPLEHCTLCMKVFLPTGKSQMIDDFYAV